MSWAMRCAGVVAFFAHRCGFEAIEVIRASTGTVYVCCRHSATHIKCKVRLSDHSSRRGRRTFSIKERSPGRLIEVEAWFSEVAAGRGKFAGLKGATCLDS